MERSNPPRLCVVSLALSVALGCTSTPDAPTSSGAPLTGTDAHIFLNESIEKNYDPHVIMKRAESFFERAAYPEAIVEYQHFLDMHRAHVLAPYAQYKLGESHFGMAKSVDRDPEPVHEALDALHKLLQTYPGSKFEIDALVKIRQCENWLAEVDLFVGRFYLRQEAYLAAAHRFQGILETDRELDVLPDALYYLALAYKELGADAWAREQLILLAERYPHNGHKNESEQLLAALGGSQTAAVAQQPPQPPPSSIVSAVFRNGSQPRRSLPVDTATHVNGNRSPVAAPTIEPTTVIRSPAPVEAHVCRLGTWC